MTPDPSRIRRVLCIDDDPHIRAIARLAFELDGVEFNECATPRNAVTVVCEIRPDVILLDVSMPEVDGPTVLAALRQAADIRDTPVVMFSAHDPDDEHGPDGKIDVRGTIGWISKPFDTATLSEQVAVLWRAVNEG